MCCTAWTSWSSRRGGDAAGPQWRGPHHHHARHHGADGRRKGSIKINGQETIQLPTHKIAHLGVGYCPEERGIFSSLSCEENLMLPPPLKTGEKGMSVEEIYEMFPNLPSAATARARACRGRAADAGRGPHSAHRRTAAAAR
jgi:ABC-type lipopolysaccharide export system ATPase subunit